MTSILHDMVQDTGEIVLCLVVVPLAFVHVYADIPCLLAGTEFASCVLLFFLPPWLLPVCHGCLQKRKAAAISDSDGEDQAEASDDDGDEDDASEGQRPAARSKPASKSSQPAASADPKVKRLQRVCKEAGIKIVPTIYVKVRAVCAELGHLPRATQDIAAGVCHADGP